jgi:cytochrome c-type biogenesis protein CcsB
MDNASQSWDGLSQAFFLALFALQGVVWGLLLAWNLSGKAVYGRRAQRVLWVAMAWNLFALGFRWWAAGHAPWANQYESATMVAFGVMLLYTYFQHENPLPVLGLLVIPAAMVAIAAASLLPPEYKHIAPLMPALQSYWLKIHVSLMLISYGAFATTFGVSLLYLIRAGVWTRRTTWIALSVAGPIAGVFFGCVHKSANSDFWTWLMGSLGATELAKGDLAKVYAVLAGAGLACGWLAAFVLGFIPARLAEGLPSAELLDELNYRSVAIGFPLLTLGIILGAIWGHVAWGRYWAWDPKETWAFISWLIFAFYLHVRLFLGWDGKRVAWVGLVGAGSIVFTYWGVNFLLSGLHAYAKP